jgi:hypothetical protein
LCRILLPFLKYAFHLTIILRPSIGGDKLSELTSKKKTPKSINKQQQKRKNIV